MPEDSEEFDAVFVGSGFGAAVTACRLAPLFTTSCILERGRRYEAQDFPRVKLPEYLTADPDLTTSQRLPDVSRASWVLDQGLFDLRNLGRLRVVQAAGWGGGSLIYANVHLRPPDSTFASWPKEYRDSPLDDEYGYVARKLGAQPLPPDRRASLPKAELMRKAAERLKRPLADDGAQTNFFYPPLAIDFARCNNCGNCTIGCQEGAKNTLDKNYLCEAERKAEVRTLCEVLRLEANELEREKKHYRVVYYDHLERRQREISTPYVFLGAGALGTTEILFRSRKHGLIPDEAEWEKRSGLDQLGKTFFGNGDNLGVVFDTDDYAAPSQGPTITTTVMHVESDAAAAQAGSPTWFLLQDGGIPSSAEPLLGAFRSPQWLGRNRLTKARRRDLAWSQAQPGLDDRALADFELAAGDLATSLFQRRARLTAQESLSGRFPLEWIAALPSSVRTWVSMVRDLSDRARAEVSRFDERVLDKVARDTFYLSKLFVDRGRLLDHIADTLAELFPPLRRLLREQMGLAAAVDIAKFLVLGAPPNQRTLLLLVMGPDPAGMLTFDRHERLRLQWSTRAQDAASGKLFALQERLMRDFAVELGGELRTNPDWTIGRHAVSVHAQGGCSMASEPGSKEEMPKGVTSPDGRVFGFRGIYVVDAAAFPGSVGANPSATIAAVAERKARWFAKDIRNKPLERRPPIPLITRLNSTGKTALIKSEPVGITWQEHLAGFLVEVAATERLSPASLSELERRGGDKRTSLRLQLNVQLDDFDGFAHAFRGRNPRLPHATVKGKVFIGDEAVDIADKSTLTFLAERDGPRGKLRLLGMCYRLNLEVNPRVRIPRLVGQKYFREEPGQAVWSDLTTLFVRAERSKDLPEIGYGGIARVSLRDFVNVQLPSFNALVEGDAVQASKPGSVDSPQQSARFAPDEVARAWALTRFAWLLFRGLTEEYAR